MRSEPQKQTTQVGQGRADLRETVSNVKCP